MHDEFEKYREEVRNNLLILQKQFHLESYNLDDNYESDSVKSFYSAEESHCYYNEDSNARIASEGTKILSAVITTAFLMIMFRYFKII